MRVGNKIDTDEGWKFHNLSKGIMKRFLDSQTKDVSILSELKVEHEWIEIEDGPPGREPFNVDLIKSAIKEYEIAINTGKIKVPLQYKPFWKPVMNEVLSYYIQDSAYYERLGGMATFLISNGDRWKKGTKEERDKLLVDLYNWWNQNDIRDYSKGWIDSAFIFIVKKYRTDQFFEQSVTFFIDYLVRHHKRWLISGWFNPNVWYPRGRGQIPWLLNGRRG